MDCQFQLFCFWKVSQILVILQLFYIEREMSDVQDDLRNDNWESKSIPRRTQNILHWLLLLLMYPSNLGKSFSTSRPFLCVNQIILWNVLIKMGNSKDLIFLLKNLYMYLLQIIKWMRQGYICSHLIYSIYMINDKCCLLGLTMNNKGTSSEEMDCTLGRAAMNVSTKILDVLSLKR